MAAFEPIGVDMYNQSISSEIAKTLNCAATDADHVPCVIEVIPIEGNGSRPSHKGDGYNEGGANVYTE